MPSKNENDFTYVKYRIKEEGFDYCFRHYSNFEDIKDEKFHLLRQKYLESAVELEKYVNQQFKTEEL